MSSHCWEYQGATSLCSGDWIKVLIISWKAVYLLSHFFGLSLSPSTRAVSPCKVLWGWSQITSRCPACHHLVTRSAGTVVSPGHDPKDSCWLHRDTWVQEWSLLGIPLFWRHGQSHSILARAVGSGGKLLCQEWFVLAISKGQTRTIMLWIHSAFWFFKSIF